MADWRKYRSDGAIDGAYWWYQLTGGLPGVMAYSDMLLIYPELRAEYLKIKQTPSDTLTQQMLSRAVEIESLVFNVKNATRYEYSWIRTSKDSKGIDTV